MSWFIIRCTSGQEGKAERYLERMGYPHAWHPKQKRRLSEAVYQRLLRAAKKLPNWARSKPPSRHKVIPYVYGYVFLPTDDIEPHRINGHHSPQVWMEVLCVNGNPYRLRDEDMTRMRDIPDTLKALIDEAERKAYEEWQAKRPVIGGRAKVISGIFEGYEAVVTEIRAGEVVMDLTTVGPVKLPETTVEKVA